MTPKNTPMTKELSPQMINAQKWMFESKLISLHKQLPQNLVRLIALHAPIPQKFRVAHKMYEAGELSPEVGQQLKPWLKNYEPTMAPSKTKQPEKSGKQPSTAQSRPQSSGSSTTTPSTSLRRVSPASSAARTQILTRLLALSRNTSTQQKIKRYKMSSKAKELLEPWERAAAGDLNALSDLSPGFRDQAIKTALRKIDKEYAKTPVSKRPYPEEIKDKKELRRLRKEMANEDRPLVSRSTTAQDQA